MEVVNCLMLAFDLEYISEQKILELRFNIDIVANKLNGLKKSLDRRFE